MGCVRVVGSWACALVDARGLNLLVGPWVRASKYFVGLWVRASKTKITWVRGSKFLMGSIKFTWVLKNSFWEYNLNNFW